MAKKKSFKDSPAMQFLSVPAAGGGEDSTESEEPIIQKENPTSAPESAPSISPGKKKTEPPAKTKFTEIPAEVLTEKATKTAVPMKPNPAYIETRSKRVQLLMQPSLYAGLRRAADKQQISLNELVHTILNDWLNTQK